MPAKQVVPNHLVSRAKTSMSPEYSPYIARLLAVAFTLGPAAMPTSVRAAPPPPVDKAEVRQAEVVAAQAKQAFRDGQFEYAARLFMKAYAISKQPALLYNAARAYEEAGKPGDATSLFRLYATVSDDPDGIADAWARIRRLEGKGEPAGPDRGKPSSPERSKPDSVESKPASSAPAEPTPPDDKPAASKPNEPTKADKETPASAPSLQGPENGRAGDAKPVEGSVPVSRRSESVVPAAAKKDVITDRTLAWVATGGAAVAVGAGVAIAWIGAAKTHDANLLPLRSQADINTYNATFDRAELLTTAGVSLIAVGLLAAGAATWLHLRTGTALTVESDGRGGVWLAGRW